LVNKLFITSPQRLFKRLSGKQSLYPFDNNIYKTKNICVHTVGYFIGIKRRAGRTLKQSECPCASKNNNF
ncbi:hypothetical protein, partial [uncultured Pedobacter sp.]|uniref:hypothetical protein n=1 Tax=uncultured Pedobacter sp. TaxID=246139 RepID=UPI0025F21B96